MCGPPKDNSAQIARQAEIARQGRITEGTSAINQQFSKFNDDFFQGIEQNALDFFNPQLQDQFGDARELTVKNLARSGNLNSSSGAKRLADLQRALSDHQAQIGSRSRDLRLNSESDVNNSRADLISQLQASADPGAAAQSAIARSASLSTQPTLNPLVDLFSSFLSQGGNVLQARRLGYAGAQNLFPGDGGGNGGGGSSTVIS